jgi:hypothetical protein
MWARRMRRRDVTGRKEGGRKKGEGGVVSGEW